MNDVYGPLFSVSRAEAATPEMADERARNLADQFIMDMHTHFLRDDTRLEGFVRSTRGRRQSRLESRALRQNADARRSEVCELLQGDLFRQRHQGRTDLRFGLRRAARLVPDE